MAEIKDELVLDIDQALRDVTRIEQALDRALAPVELRIDDSSIQRVEDSLRDVREVVEDTTGQVRLTAAEYREVTRAIESGVTPARAIAEATGQMRQASALAEGNFRDLARALDVSEDEARRLTDEILQAQRASARLEEATRDVARQLNLSDDEANRLVRSLREADRAAGGIETGTVGIHGAFLGLRATVLTITAALATIGGGQILGAATRGVQAALIQFQNLNESINAVNVTFETAAGTILGFGDISAQVAGLSASAFQQAVVPIGSVLRNFGFDANEAADASIILVQRAADLASVFNTDVSEALLAINSALVGQVEPLRRYGAEISVARTEQFALAQGIIQSKDEFDEQARVAARVGLILQDTARVQGDFVNTSDELANAQRIATAETQNFAAGVGEDLAPAMAELVGLLPEMLDGLQQLVPFLATGADSAADFFRAIGEGGGMREEFATIGAIVGTTTSGLGVLSSVASGVFDIIRGDAEGAKDAFSDLGTVLARNIIRPFQVDLARALDRGEDSINAVRVAIERTARTTVSLDAFKEAFRGFAIQADLTKQELFELTSGLLRSGAAAGLAAPEIAFLQETFFELHSELGIFIDAADQAARTMADVDDVAVPFTTTLDQVRLAAADAGLSLTDLVLATDPAAQAIVELLDPADRTALAMQAIATESGAAAAIFESTLRPAIADVSDALEDLNDDGRVTRDEFIQNLRDMTVAQLQFAADIAAISAIDPDVAAQLLTLPIERALEIVREFAGDPEGIRAAAEAIFGAPNQLEAAILDIYIAAISALHGDDPRARAAAIANVVASFEDPALGRRVGDRLRGILQPALNASFADLEPPDLLPVIQESIQGMNNQAITASLSDELTFSFADLEFPDTTGQMTRSIDEWDAAEIARAVETRFEGIDFNIELTDEGIEAGISFVEGMVQGVTSGRAVNDLHVAIEDATNDAIEARSPSRLFLRLGESAGDAFWSGFEQAELTLRTPTPTITGSIAGTTAAAGVVSSAGLTYAPTIINPVVEDLESTLARNTQLLGAVAGILNGRFKL